MLGPWGIRRLLPNLPPRTVSSCRWVSTSVADAKPARLSHMQSQPVAEGSPPHTLEHSGGQPGGRLTRTSYLRYRYAQPGLDAQLKKEIRRPGLAVGNASNLGIVRR